MKKENLILLALTVLASVTTGCAQNLAGTYTGTEIVSLTSVATSGGGVVSPAVPTTAPMTLTINQSSGTLLTGTWNSQGQIGTFQGTVSGSSVSAVMLTMQGIPTSAMQSTYGTSYNPALQQGMCNSFSGTLNLSPNNQLTGTLSVIQTAQPQVQQGYGQQGYGSGYSCSGTRTVTATKTN